jgi:predicted nucleic acid-binding protein
VILLDAYALIAFLTGGPATGDVRGLLRSGEAGVATANLAEALDVSARVHGLPIARACDVLDPLFETSLIAVDLDRDIARRSADARARHDLRTSRAISLADAILIASAGSGDRIATADAALLAVAEAEGRTTIGLPPDS